MEKKEKIIIAAAIIVTLLAGLLQLISVPPVLAFAVTGVALALLAMVVGDGTEQLGSRLGPGATGVLQSGLGNLPELFVLIFALRAGLETVATTALVGSILGNSVLVFGFAILFGGLRNGTLKFKSEPPRMIATLMLLAFAALALPTLAKELHTPADSHIDTLDVAVAIALLIVFAASIYFFVTQDPSVSLDQESMGESRWSLKTTLIVLAISGVGAAFVSEWFVGELEPAMKALGISEAFAGLVIVALAGNAIENIVGVQLAWRGQADYAVSVILNSSLQIALGLFPALVLLSFVLGGSILSFVLSPLLLISLALAVLVSAFIVFDGKAIWLEGLALIVLYFIIAAAFWWG
ncbi:MAG: sodium:proton exchanger [Pyrinomonadaceae bacterium]